MVVVSIYKILQGYVCQNKTVYSGRVEVSVGPADLNEQKYRKDITIVCMIWIYYLKYKLFLWWSIEEVPLTEMNRIPVRKQTGFILRHSFLLLAATTKYSAENGNKKNHKPRMTRQWFSFNITEFSKV